MTHSEDNSKTRAAVKSRGLIFDTIAYGLQGALPQVLAFLLLPLFTSVLSPDDYAAVNLATVFAAFAAGVAHLQIPAIVGRFFFDCEPDEVPTFFSTIFVATAATCFIVLGVLIIFGQPLVDFVYPKADLDFFPLFFLALCSVAISALVRVSATLLQVQKKASTLLRISVIVAVLHFSSSVLYVVVFGWGPTGVLLAVITSGLCNLLLLLFTVRSYLTRDLDASYITPGLKYCVPLIPHMYGAMLFVSSDKIILEKFVSLTEVGVYAVAAKLALPLLIIVDAFNRSVSPRFMESSKRSKPDTVEEFRDIITKWFAFVVVTWIGFSFFAPEAVLLMTPESYHGATIFLSILAGSYIFRGLYCFAVNPLFYEKKTTWIPFITFTAGIANVALNIVLIPKFGVITAAWTTLISYMLTFILAYGIGRVVYPMSWESKKLWLMGISALGIVIFEHTLAPEDFFLRLLFKTLLIVCSTVFLFHIGRIFNVWNFGRGALEYSRAPQSRGGE